MNRAIKFFILLPVFTVLWGYANSIGATQALSQATGLPDVSTWTIPGVDKVIDARTEVEKQRTEAQAMARRQAMKALRAEVNRRYGPKAAAAVPSDLTLAEAKRILAAGATVKSLTSAGMPKGPLLGKPGTKAPVAKPPVIAAGTTGQQGSPSTKADFAAALKTLGTLPVRGKGPMTGYSRDEYGTEWSDAVGNWKGWTRNGCDSRNDALKRALTPNVKFKAGTKCAVASGTFTEPYSGKSFEFIAGNRSMEHSLDIDHVVALGNVWISGGAQLSPTKRAEIANDPANLWAVSASLNRQKGDGDAATWLPPNKSFRCPYVTRQVQVKKAYGLSVTSAEKTAIAKVLNGCVR